MATSRINVLRERKADLLKELDAIQSAAGDTPFTDEQGKVFDEKMGEVSAISADLGRFDSLIREQEQRVNAEKPAAQAKPGDPGKFSHLGEQLKAIVKASTPGSGLIDQRLLMPQAATGLSESVMADGATRQQDFTTWLMQRTLARPVPSAST
jgi:hypothetical protein